MTPVIIILLIIGVIFLVVSCFLIEKNSRISDFKAETFLENSEIDKENIKTSLEEKLNKVREETLHKADVELGKLSNETIMEVSDYSNQVLDKINKNHEEVVFLYQMLNDKEEQLKKLIGQVDETKISFKKELKQVSESVQTTNNFVPLKNQASRNENIHNDSISNMEELVFTNPSSKDVIDNDDEHTSLVNKENLNHNERIINLYTEGKSVMEIARELELGQGEVKLVLDLFVK